VQAAEFRKGKGGGKKLSGLLLRKEVACDFRCSVNQDHKINHLLPGMPNKYEKKLSNMHGILQLIAWRFNNHISKILVNPSIELFLW
jgi:hypothetical protein